MDPANWQNGKIEMCSCLNNLKECALNKKQLEPNKIFNEQQRLLKKNCNTFAVFVVIYADFRVNSDWLNTMLFLV